MSYKVYEDNEETQNNDWKHYFHELNAFHVDLLFKHGLIRITFKGWHNNIFSYPFIHPVFIKLYGEINTNSASFSPFRHEVIRLLSILRPKIAFSCSDYNHFRYNSELGNAFTPSDYYDTLFAHRNCFRGENTMIDEFYDFQYVDEYLWISSPRRLGNEAPYDLPDIDGRDITDWSLKAVLDQAQARHVQAFCTTIRLSALSFPSAPDTSREMGS